MIRTLARATAVVAATAVTAVTAVAHAQTERFAPTVLQLPASARALGVGDAFVAGRGSEMLFYNPAMLALQPGMAASAQVLGSHATFGAISSTMVIGPFGIGLGAQFLEFEFDDVRAGPTDLTLLPPGASSSLVAALGLSSIFKGIRFGAAAKAVEENVNGSLRDATAAFDVGVARDFFGRATVAISARDIGSELLIEGASVELPTRLTIGAAASAPPLFTFWDLAATFAFTVRRDGELMPAGGVELSYVPLDGWAFTGRAGARRVADRSGTTPLTLGASISLDRLSLDYAYQALDVGGSAHRLGLRIR
jgi:hypothetical protein